MARSEVEKAAEALRKQAAMRAVQSKRHARVEVSAETMAEAFDGADVNFEVINRRLALAGAPPVVSAIRLSDELPAHEDPSGRKRRWYLRWFNGRQENRIHHAKIDLGYTTVKIGELRSHEAIAGLWVGEKGEGVPTPGMDVRRGEGGREILMKLPMVAHTKIKQQQREREQAKNTPTAMREEAMRRAAQMGLDPEVNEAAGPSFGQIKSRRQRIMATDSPESIEPVDVSEA